MANTFNLLRANDLIWSFVINNYLLGRDPFPFDLLHWNCDSTRMPAKMHSFYLRNMYMKNLLREPGGLTLAGVQIDLSKVTVPSVFRLGDRGPHRAVEDHLRRTADPRGQVALRAVGLGPHRRHGQSAGGQQVRLLDERRRCRTRRTQWLDGAEQHEGSWWPDWREVARARISVAKCRRACPARASSR